ncbi:hypothetical protein [Mollivirus kamchatka]|nr:hypothetical protein [Mollivirus kamchatka]
MTSMDLKPEPERDVFTSLLDDDVRKHIASYLSASDIASMSLACSVLKTTRDYRPLECSSLDQVASVIRATRTKDHPLYAHYGCAEMLGWSDDIKSHVISLPLSSGLLRTLNDIDQDTRQRQHCQASPPIHVPTIIVASGRQSSHKANFICRESMAYLGRSPARLNINIAIRAGEDQPRSRFAYTQEFDNVCEGLALRHSRHDVFIRHDDCKSLTSNLGQLVQQLDPLVSTFCPFVFIPDSAFALASNRNLNQPDLATMLAMHIFHLSRMPAVPVVMVSVPGLGNASTLARYLKTFLGATDTYMYQCDPSTCKARDVEI